MVGSVQDAKVQAVQALASLTAVMARSSPSFQAPPVPSSRASQSLACLQQAVTAFTKTSAADDDSEGLYGSDGAWLGAFGQELRAAEYAMAHRTAQVSSCSCDFYRLCAYTMPS